MILVSEYHLSIQTVIYNYNLFYKLSYDNFYITKRETLLFCRKLYIADARPRKNALANGAMGGGSESSSNYFQSEVVYFTCATL